jgi:hypothetical protein
VKSMMTWGLLRIDTIKEKIEVGMVVGQVYRYQLTENGQPELVLTKPMVNSSGNYNLCRIITTKRLAIICHHQLYKKRMAKTYIRKVWSREFR